MSLLGTAAAPPEFRTAKAESGRQDAPVLNEMVAASDEA